MLLYSLHKSVNVIFVSSFTDMGVSSFLFVPVRTEYTLYLCSFKIYTENFTIPIANINLIFKKAIADNDQFYKVFKESLQKFGKR